MKKQYVYGVLGAIVGGALTFTGSVQSDNHLSASTEAAISSAVTMAVAETTRLQREAEERELNNIPDALNCTHMEWMKTCSSINKQAKKNPNAPLRVMTKDGLEMNFAPGTPSAVMAYMLDPNDQTVAAYMDFIEKSYLHNEALAQRYTASYYKRGGIADIVSAEATMQKLTANRAIDTGAVMVNIFYESSCPHCKTLMKNMKEVKEKYPELQVRLFQLDSDVNAMKELASMHGMPVRLATPEERQRLEQSGVSIYPMTWFDNHRTKQRLRVPGSMSGLTIENHLERISAILSAEG